MTSGRDDELQRYLERVLELSETLPSGLGEEELRSIALEVGVSEDTLRAAREAAAAHLERGQGFLKHRLLSEAVRELREGRALAPYDRPLRRSLAEALVRQWQEEGGSALQREAMELLQHCLQEDPGSDALYGLLRELKRPRRRLELARLVGGALCVCAMLWGLWQQYGPGQAEPPALRSGASARQAGLDGSPTPAAAEGTLASVPEGGLPLRYRGTKTLADLRLEVLASSHKRFPDRAFYELKGRLFNETRLEVTGLKATLRLLDREGVAVATRTWDLVPGFHPGLRPGDVQPLRTMLEVPMELSRAQLAVISSSATPAPRSYPTPKTLEVAWNGDAEGGAGLIFQLRSEEQRAHGGSKVYHRLAVGVENRGARPVSLLRLEKQLLRGTELIDASSSYVVTSVGVPMRVDERRAVALGSISLAFDSWKVRVLEFR